MRIGTGLEGLGRGAEGLGQTGLLLSPGDQDRQAVGEAGYGQCPVQRHAFLHGSGGLVTGPCQCRVLQGDRSQAQGLGQRDFLFQQEGHEVRELGMAVIANDCSKDRNPRRRAA